MRTRHVHGAAVAVIGAALVLLAGAGPVAAGSAQAVTIVSNVTFNPDGPNSGDFTATGPAVDNGILCASGTFVDTFIKFAGYQSRPAKVQILVVKDFTCGNDSGTFTIKLQINADINTGYESFSWVVLGGTGSEATLHGGGTGFTVPNRPVGNFNTYQGMVAG